MERHQKRRRHRRDSDNFADHQLCQQSIHQESPKEKDEEKPIEGEKISRQGGMTYTTGWSGGLHEGDIDDSHEKKIRPGRTSLDAIRETAMATKDDRSDVLCRNWCWRDEKQKRGYGKQQHLSILA